MRLGFVWLLGGVVGCAGDEAEGPFVVDAVELTTTGDGFTIDVRWDSAGGNDMLLGVDTDYTVEVVLYDGATEVTDVVAGDPGRFQLFVTGEGFEGPATAADPVLVEHTYDDGDLGLANRLLPVATGDAELVLTLQDLGEAKEPGLAEAVKAEGLGALPGTTVVTATWPVTVL